MRERKLGTEKRKTPRKEISWAAHARNTHLSVIGAKVWDVTALGAFIEVAADAPAVSGEPVNLELFPFGQGGGHRVAGVIKWVGENATHGCHGIGVEFNPTTVSRNVSKLINEAYDLANWM